MRTREHGRPKVTSVAAFAALIPPALFAAVAVAGLRRKGRDADDRMGSLGQAAAWAGVIIAAAAGLAVAVNGETASPTLGISELGISVRLDALSVTMLLMIAVIAAVVYRFSRTYLDGEARKASFLGRLAITIAAVEVMVIAGNLFLLVAAWLGTSLALHTLLTFHQDRPRALVAARKKFFAARTSDAFLVVAAVLLYRHTGTGDLGAIFESVATEVTRWSLSSVDVAAMCLAVAAALKAAQFPTHGWLIEVMDTPTPVSALLHAGILNAGPFLAIRMAFVLDASSVATTLLLIIGGITAAFASVALLTQPSIKVVLAYSSAAHMGFMLMLCGMGLYPAALLHLVAHSFYKAHSFLSSGSVIDEQRAAGVALPRRLGSPGRILASAAAATAFYLPLALVWGQDLRGEPMLIAIGGILVLGTTQLIAPTLDSDGPWIGAARAAALALGVTLSFFVLETGAHLLLSDAVPELNNRDGLQLLLIGIVLAVFTTVVVLQIIEPTRTGSARRRAIAVHMRNGLYANAVYDRLIGALHTPAIELGPGELDRSTTRPQDRPQTSPSPNALESTWN
jgi:NAD(P)H-quinone oxidoreductase subunit 5